MLVERNMLRFNTRVQTHAYVFSNSVKFVLLKNKYQELLTLSIAINECPSLVPAMVWGCARARSV